MLHTWGGIYNDDSPIPDELRQYNGYTYFNTKKELNSVLMKICPYGGYGLCTDIKEGNLTHKRTIACMTVLLDDKEYYLEYDFGYEYPEDVARFKFMENTCDCNMYNRLSDEYDELEPMDYPCGFNIKVVDFKVEYRD